jgi:hypothetical protein
VEESVSSQGRDGLIKQLFAFVRIGLRMKHNSAEQRKTHTLYQVAQIHSAELSAIRRKPVAAAGFAGL